MALDWAKAFDRISPTGLIDALRRFGLPHVFLDIIQNIYKDREFFVRDMGHQSTNHFQCHGISQGCPLSPFLFVIVMTIVMHDATTKLQQMYGDILITPLLVHDLLYADDTLLFDVHASNVQKYMDVIISVGGEYGLQINWGKWKYLVFDVIRIFSQQMVYKSSKNNQLHILEH